MPASTRLTCVLFLGALSACAPSGPLPGAGDSVVAPGGKADRAGELANQFDRLETFVLRSRLEYSTRPHDPAVGGWVVDMNGQPYSHRSRKWHVFPFTSFDGNAITLEVHNRDPQMAGHLGAWLYGPRDGDGAWPPPRMLTMGANDGSLTFTTPGYGHYALAVGATVDDEGEGAWLPRYEGVRADFGVLMGDEAEGSVTMHVVVEQGGAYLALDESSDVDEAAEVGVEPGVRYAINFDQAAYDAVEQQTGEPAAPPFPGSGEETFVTDGPKGRVVFVLDQWQRNLWAVPERVATAVPADVRARIPNLPPDPAPGELRPGMDFDAVPLSIGEDTPGFITVEEAEGATTYQVVQAIAADGSDLDEWDTDPAFVRVVPDAVFVDGGAIGRALTMAEYDEHCPHVDMNGDGDLDGRVCDARARSIDVIDDPACEQLTSGGLCLPVPVWFEHDDDAYYELDAAGDIAAIKADHVVPQDVVRSFRSLFTDQEETSTYDVRLTCRGENCGRIQRGLPTRYPVYFAHGFNSSRAAWDEVRGKLGEANWPAWWTDAQDVPGYEPVANRAEVLRQHLTRFLGTLNGRVPEDETFLRVNVVAHSMGGLDARYLMGAWEYNEGCLDGQGRTGPTDPDRTPSGKCDLDLNGHVIFWRHRIASLTTLSTPHCGSTFASWGVETLQSSRQNTGFLNWTFRNAAQSLLGGDPDQVEQTLEALSVEYHLAHDDRSRFNDVCEGRALPFDQRIELSRRLGNGYGSNAQARSGDRWDFVARQYDWQAATSEPGYLDRMGIPAEHRPRNGELPPPWIGDGTTRRPVSGTIFSWTGAACSDGRCGASIDPALAVPHRIETNRMRDAGFDTANDGVVTVESGRGVGIYMGTRPTDHFHWNRINDGRFARTWRWFQGGVEAEPVDRFFAYWFARLAAAGY